MDERKEGRGLTKKDMEEVIARAGGPKAVRDSFDQVDRANAQLEKDYKSIVEQYLRHWIVIGPDGLIGTLPVPEDASVDDQEQALVRLFEIIEESGNKRKGYLVQYIGPEGESLIL